MAKKKEEYLVCKCGHEVYMHANPENHILKTSHCTALESERHPCQCKEFVLKQSAKPKTKTETEKIKTEISEIKDELKSLK